MSEHCPYCEGGPALADFAYKVGDISDYSTLYLFKEQSHPGRMVVSFKRHLSEIADLTDEEVAAYMADVARVARMIRKMYKPDKINYGAFGDLLPHLHFHMVPKYRDGFEWGGIFQMNPRAKELTDEEAAVIIEKIRKEMPLK